MTYEPGEGPIDDINDMRARAKAERAKPEHHKPEHDRETVDGDIDDPKHQRKDDE